LLTSFSEDPSSLDVMSKNALFCYNKFFSFATIYLGVGARLLRFVGKQSI